MLRESLDAGAPCVALMTTPGSRIDLQYRRKPDASSRWVTFVSSKTPQWLKLVRQRHLITVHLQQKKEFSSHEEVEIAGNLTWQNNLPVLTEAYPRPVSKPAAQGNEAASSLKLQDIRIADLPSETEDNLQYAGRAFLVHGVVTFSDHLFNRNLLFLQDDSGGALVRVLPELAQYRPLEAGQFVEAEGNIKFTRGMAPFGVASVTVLGRGEMPRPLPYSSRLLARDVEAQWVEMSGIVRSIQKDGSLLLMERDGALTAWISGVDTNSLIRYVDSLVHIRGVYSKNIRSYPVLLVPSLDYIEVKESPPKDPFVIPLLSINQVNVQNVNPQTRHRLKVAGVVTYRDKESLFVQDDTGGAQVLTMAADAAEVGDRVEIIGFPEDRSESVAFTEAMVRKIGPGKSAQACFAVSGRCLGGVVQRLGGASRRNRIGTKDPRRAAIAGIANRATSVPSRSGRQGGAPENISRRQPGADHRREPCAICQ